MDHSVSPSLAHLSVLLIDDDTFMLDLIGSMLELHGIRRLVTAADGERGVRAFDSNAMPDLVICDLNMPGKDGFQVMEHLAARGYQGSVIVLTGMDERVRNSASLMGRFHQLHIAASLAKPVKPAGLRVALESVLARRA
jgi:CheY-like chemotaxis protein